jgi:hypothetical protein
MHIAKIDYKGWPNSYRLTHRLRNLNLWEVKLAPWAMSVMAAGGVAILPLPPRQSYERNLQPTHSMTFWAYTDMTDPRWTWGKTHLLLRQDQARQDLQKIGLMAPDGWIAYARQGHLFVKRADFMSGVAYPDYGSSLEVFTNGDMLENECRCLAGRCSPCRACRTTSEAVAPGMTWARTRSPRCPPRRQPRRPVP